MQEDELLFPQDIYSKHLSIINGVNFTQREIDVIACLLSVRGTSKIASLLSIAPRTVVTHVRNIMLKLECNSREGIIDFIERSGKLSFIRRHYTSLFIQEEFEKSLKEIANLKQDKPVTCLIVYWEDINLKSALIYHLGNHLTQAGVNTEIRDQGQKFSIENVEKANYALLLLVEKKDHQEVSQDFVSFDSIDLEAQKNYFFLVFEILKKLFPNARLEEITVNFKEKHERIGKVDISRHSQFYSNGKKPEKKVDNFKYEIGRILVNKKGSLISVLLAMGFLNIGFLVSQGGNNKREQEQNQGHVCMQHKNQEGKEEPSIRSDLVIPMEYALLYRPELIAQIDDNLKGRDGIQTIALVGPGGAGKTTLARQYAYQQKAAVVWEINAETRGSLKGSFENLAYALSTMEEDRKMLKELQEMKAPEEREKKIIQFVKERLRLHPNWFLIYDNIEKFTDIQKYSPQDSTTWGQGKIILTTRDSNIQNNKHVNNVIQLRELTLSQKFTLFSKIMNYRDLPSFTFSQNEEAKKFLERTLPPKKLS